MHKIPDAFRDIPAAVKLREAEARFAAAIEQEKRVTQQSGERVHLISGQLRQAQDELKKAQDAFDVAAGEPKPPGLTNRVIEEISRLFPVHERETVADFLDRSCGRTIPFRREATAQQLEYVRLCALRLSKGDFAKLRQEVEMANIEEGVLTYTAAPLMSDYKVSV
jgi:hypothetical protein